MTSLPISGTDRYSIYTGRVTNWPMVALTSVLGVLLVAVQVLNGPWWGIAAPLALAAVGVAANVLTASSVRATVGPNGVTVHWGVAGWPRSRYPLASIVKAEVIHVPWWLVSWGFWWTPRRTCCTVRPGPTLRLLLANARTVTITVPDPAAALAALDAARAAEAAG